MSIAALPPLPAPPTLSEWIRQNKVMAIALAVSIGLHAALLTIRFVAPDMLRLKAKDPGLEVVLVNTKSNRKPAKAEFLAQNNLEGGGDKDQGRATSPMPNAGMQYAGDALIDSKRRLEELDAEQKKLLSTAKSPLAAIDPMSELKNPTQAPNQNAVDLVDSAKALANQAAIIEARISAENKRPKKHFFGASAQDYSAALYVDNFRAKVERWGNLNYPEAARGKFYGQTQVTVTIDKDGTIFGVELDKRSGQPVLDKAALEIIRRAAPFGRFTEQMAKEMDLLVITRTLIFTNDTLESR